MPLRLRLIAAALAAAPLAAQGAQEGLKLRPSYSLLPPPADDALLQDAPVFIEADEVEGRQGQSLEACGQVELRTRGRVLSADRMSYAVPTEEVTATGNVRLDRRGDVLQADKVFFNLRTEQGYADAPRYFFREFNARGKASKLYLDSKTRYRATDATYSTCENPEKGWYLRVGRLRLDRDKDSGVARDATLRFKDTPIFYTPYVDFPLSTARKSGFLSPTYGTTGRSGFEFTLPFYLNLAPNYDATVAPRYLAKRGVALNAEGRYLGRTFDGMLNAEYLDKDRERQGDSRYALAFRHNQTVLPGLTAAVNLQKVSDDQYFVDLSNRVAVTSLVNLPRDAALSYTGGGWWSAGLRTQSWQTLQDPAAPIVPPYARLPQLTYSAAASNVRGLDIGLRSEYVDFSHPYLENGRRAIVYPSVAYPLQRSFVTVVPKLGLHYTYYDRQEQFGFSDTSRTLPVFSVDSTVTFERTTVIRGRALTQTLEPRLYYVYIPFVDQSTLPVFDTAVADFNFAQMFTENQFIGGDRINDANQLTAALSTRFIDPVDGQERLRFSVGQRFFFRGQQVTLPNTAVRTQNESDMILGLSGRVTRALYLDSMLMLDTNEARQERSSLVFRYNPQPGRVVNVGYRFNRDAFEQTDFSFQWPFTEKWAGVGRWAYSLGDRQSVATIGGVEYNAGCWVARFVLQQFVTLGQVSNRGFFLQLEFSGLSRIGSNPLQILRQNVAGYQQINALPQSQLQDDYYPMQ
jgi:LPS-assembly protein